MDVHKLESVFTDITELRNLTDDVIGVLEKIYNADGVRMTGTNANVDTMNHKISELLGRWYRLNGTWL